jgi:hypothetical protein
VQFSIFESFILEHFFDRDHCSGFYYGSSEDHAKAPIADNLLGIELPLLPVNHLADIWCRGSSGGTVRAVASSPIPLRLLPRELVYCATRNVAPPARLGLPVR